jgi:hypothetical protein
MPACPPTGAGVRGELRAAGLDAGAAVPVAAFPARLAWLAAACSAASGDPGDEALAGEPEAV